MIDFYKEKGYLDVRVVRDSFSKDKNGNVSLNIALKKGKRYYFGDIRFLENSVYDRDRKSVV